MAVFGGGGRVILVKHVNKGLRWRRAVDAHVFLQRESWGS